MSRPPHTRIGIALPNNRKTPRRYADHHVFSHVAPMHRGGARRAHPVATPGGCGAASRGRSAGACRSATLSRRGAAGQAPKSPACFARPGRRGAGGGAALTGAGFGAATGAAASSPRAGPVAVAGALPSPAAVAVLCPRRVRFSRAHERFSRSYTSRRAPRQTSGQLVRAGALPVLGACPTRSTVHTQDHGPSTASAVPWMVSVARPKRRRAKSSSFCAVRLARTDHRPRRSDAGAVGPLVSRSWLGDTRAPRPGNPRSPVGRPSLRQPNPVRPSATTSAGMVARASIQAETGLFIGASVQ